MIDKYFIGDWNKGNLKDVRIALVKSCPDGRDGEPIKESQDDMEVIKSICGDTGVRLLFTSRHILIFRSEDPSVLVTSVVDRDEKKIVLSKEN